LDYPIKHIALLQQWIKKVVHAGIPPHTAVHIKRHLALGNSASLLAFLFTLPNIPQFIGLSHSAGNQAAISAGCASFLYLCSYALLVKGYRYVGLILLVLTVLANLCVLSLVLGTDSGVPYYFIPIGMGIMLIWPPGYKATQFIISLITVTLFISVLIFANNTPYFSPALAVSDQNSLLIAQSIGAYFIAFVFIFYSASSTEKAERHLMEEKKKSESLLLNILPEKIAKRLKQEETIADDFECISVLFCDLVGFTKLSQDISAKQLVILLNDLFSRFDHLLEQHQLEKIKTIGDAYMVAAGIPEPRQDHADAIMAMALAMFKVIDNYNAEKHTQLSVRIGINSGPAVAGVIGKKKFSYDLWGDTVNLASRMESHGFPDHIQMTESCYDLLKDKSPFIKREKIYIKGKGEMVTYLYKK